MTTLCNSSSFRDLSSVFEDTYETNESCNSVISAAFDFYDGFASGSGCSQTPKNGKLPASESFAPSVDHVSLDDDSQVPGDEDDHPMSNNEEVDLSTSARFIRNRQVGKWLANEIGLLEDREFPEIPPPTRYFRQRK
mmetsp:Transcript_17881/g.43285  ORF Transcript_17881/g.43285 Transcript_17881/m.43285 type:complete len:137 (+) Transcript_17881:218-628(+)